MIAFTIIALLFLLATLWAPPLLGALRLKPQANRSKVHALAVILPLQVTLAAALCFFANHIGLLNPAGYVLGICVAVGLGGAAVLLGWLGSANQVLNATARRRAAR